jgi:hypothetical protein
MKPIIHFLIAAVTVSCVGCCCFEPIVSDENGPIIVREATISEFNTKFIGNNPDPSFNIAMYRFPGNVNSSGELPNDPRFANGQWTAQSVNWPARGLTSYYIFSSPPNSLMQGDFLAVDVDPTASPRRAVLRVRGRLYRLPNVPSLQTDDAFVFASEIRKFASTQNVPVGSSLCKELDALSLQYGTTTPTAIRSFDTMYVKTTAGADTNLSYPNQWLTKPDNTQYGPLKDAADINIYEVSFSPGDWFYYKAVNGSSFFVLITNIDNGVLDPFVNRVTFKFAEAYKCLDCKK